MKKIRSFTLNGNMYTAHGSKVYKNGRMTTGRQFSDALVESDYNWVDFGAYRDRRNYYNEYFSLNGQITPLGKSVVEALIVRYGSVEMAYQIIGSKRDAMPDNDRLWKLVELLATAMVNGGY